MSTLKVNDIVEATSGGGKLNVARAWFVGYNLRVQYEMILKYRL